MQRKRSIVWLICAGCMGALILINASWLAPAPHGQAKVVAQRGVSQTYTLSDASDNTCTARWIRKPVHDFIENTSRSIGAAFAAGADVVEVDIRMTGGFQFVLFHDEDLACRTNGSGKVSAHTVSELQTLDVGYGYTADGGQSFPLRGKGMGLMPTLAEILAQYPDGRFLIQIKDGDPGVADHLVAYLESYGLTVWGRVSFFGASAPLDRLKQRVPTANTWSARSASRCVVGYLETGWFGHVPRACENAMILIPIDQAAWVWGWPNRFLTRMQEHGTGVMLFGKLHSSMKTFSRLDTSEELARVPAGFDGLIWTDQIAVIGPAARERASRLVKN